MGLELESLYPLLVRLQQEVSSLQPARGSSPEADRAGTLISDFRPPKQ